MPGMFRFRKFADFDINDSFFDTLKNDYPEFPQWYQKKSDDGATALVFSDDEGLGAFVYLKSENEQIKLTNGILPAVLRMKIGTLKLADRYHGQRLGEGALGLALWKWRKTQEAEIYVTVFEKHSPLVSLLERFGFKKVSYKDTGEAVYLKSRFDLDYSDPYKSFPFINPEFSNSGYLVVNDTYHDTLFPYSELKNTFQEQLGLSVANGLTKIYVGSPYSALPYQIGDPILVYRKYTGGKGAAFKSCVTSYCIVTDIIVSKANGKTNMSINELIGRIKNKSVFDEKEIRTIYEREKNLTAIEMLYYGFFGEGNNVNWAWLKDNGYMGQSHPGSIRLSPEQFKAILREGKVDVQNIIIN
jgi:hypothetical protein